MEITMFRHRQIIIAWLVALSLALVASPAFAQSIGALKDGLSWGMTRVQVEKLHKDELIKDYRQQISGSRDIVRNDKLRKKVDDDQRKFEATWVEFDGARTGYESSTIANEIFSGANLAMLIQADADNPKYYVFKNDRLVKIVIATNVAALDFMPFHTFVETLSKRYGKPQNVETELDDIGVKVDIRARWVDSGDRLRIENRDRVYNTYLMVLTDASKDDFMRGKNLAEEEGEGSLDDIFKAAAAESHDRGDIVDRLTNTTSDVQIRLRSDAQAGDALTSQSKGSSAMDDTEVLEDVEKLERRTRKSRTSKPAKKSTPSSSGSGGGRTIY